MPGCPGVLALQCLQVQSNRVQVHMLLFFHKDETTMHLPNDMQQPMGHTYIQR